MKINEPEIVCLMDCSQLRGFQSASNNRKANKSITSLRHLALMPATQMERDAVPTALKLNFHTLLRLLLVLHVCGLLRNIKICVTPTIVA